MHAITNLPLPTYALHCVDVQEAEPISVALGDEPICGGVYVRVDKKDAEKDLFKRMLSTVTSLAICWHSSSRDP
jgi:hypothetical protein